MLALCTASGQSPGSTGRIPRLPDPGLDPLPASEGLIRRARELADGERYRESAEAWAAVAVAEPAVAAFAQRERIRALLGAGDLQGALSGLTQLEGPAPADLLLRAAAAARSAGALDNAAALYRQARNSAGRSSAADEAAIGLAATLEQDGKPRAALETFRELQLTFRQASAYDVAAGGARRLSTQLGGADPLTESDYDAIADRLDGVAAFQRAGDVLTEWKANFPDSTKGPQIEATIVRNLYSLRSNDAARARAEIFLKQFPESPEAPAVFVTLFRLDVREGKDAETDRRGRAILSGQVKGTTLSDRQSAGRLLAEYLVSVGQPTRALSVYDQIYRMTKQQAERLDLLWRMSIASLRAGNRTRAINELKQVLRLKPDSETERAATFWLAYAEDADGSKTAAQTLWAALVRRYPFSYYGVRAAARLGTDAPEPALAFPDLTLSDAVIAHADYRAAVLLAGAGLLPEAATHARRLNSAFRRNAAVALLSARASEAAGDHSSASTLMSSYFGQFLERPSTGLPDDFWLLAYPRAYWTAVSTAAAQHKVDPLLMLALARQESHFNSSARSPVGAIGLFQIMPYTAAELDPALATSEAAERLVESDLSAELAATLIERLLDRYQGTPAPAIASYNADKERVQVWWEAARGLPEELFVDSIPYRETRGYVRQVLANYSMYQRFAAQSASPRK